MEVYWTKLVGTFVDNVGGRTHAVHKGKSSGRLCLMRVYMSRHPC